MAATSQFGRRLYMIRRQLGLTQTELAGDDMSASYISLLEKGKRRPTPETVVKLAARLEVAPEQLTDDRPDPAPPSLFAADESEQYSVDLHEAQLTLLGGEAAAALSAFRELLDSAAAGPLVQRRALLGVAQCAERLGRADEAEDAYEQWLASDDEDLSSHTDWLTAVAGLCRCRREAGEVAEALALATQALTELSELGLNHIPAAAPLIVELVHLHSATDSDGTGDLLTDALVSLTRRSGPASQHEAYLVASRAALERGRHRLAANLATEAVAVHRRGVEQALARWLRAVAPALLGADGQELAAAYGAVAEASTELHRVADPREAASCDIELAQLHLALGQPGDAGEVLRVALERLGDAQRLSRARATLVLARAQWAQRHPEAVHSYELSAHELVDLGLQRSAAQVYFELAAGHEQRGETAEAMTAYRQAADVMGVGRPPEVQP